MNQTGGTERIPPYISLEPGEFTRRMPVDSTSFSLFKAADFVDDAGRIEKSMEMTAVDGNLMSLACNYRTALSAYQRFLGIGAGIVDRIGYRGVNCSGLYFFPAAITVVGGPSIRVYDSGQQ